MAQERYCLILVDFQIKPIYSSEVIKVFSQALNLHHGGVLLMNSLALSANSLNFPFYPQAAEPLGLGDSVNSRQNSVKVYV
jgi:hypothetical protein